MSGAYAASEDNVTSCELMGRQGIDLVLQHIPDTADPLGEKHDWYVLMEWSSTRAHREGGNAEGLREKMEAYLGEAMDKGLVLDAVIAQTEAQSKSLWALRENHTEASKKEGPSIKHDISVAVSKIPSFVPEGLAAMNKALPGCRPLVFGHVGDGNLHFNCQAPAGWDKARFCTARRGDQRRDLRSGDGLWRLDLGRARYRPHQGRRAGALPQQDRARHHAHPEASTRPAKHHESRQGDPGLSEC